MIRLVGSTGHGSTRRFLSRGLVRLESSSFGVRCFGSTSPLGDKGIPYSELTVGIPKERFPLEKRVAATPESVQRLVKPGFTVLVEDGAGETAHFSNADYEAAGAKIVTGDDPLQVWKDSNVILKLRPPTPEQVQTLDKSKTLFSFLYPRQNEELLKQLQDQGTTAFAMDMIPRTLSRGQTYDALSVSSVQSFELGLCLAYRNLFLFCSMLHPLTNPYQHFIDTTLVSFATPTVPTTQTNT